MADAILRQSGIYAIRNLKTGKVYIGRAGDLQTRTRRHFVLLESGTHHSSKLQNSYHKHGAKHFSVEILLLCATKDLEMYEQICIDGFDAYKNGYNCCPISGAPMAGRTSSAETKRKQSLSRIGRPRTAATVKKMSDSKKGIKFSAEHKAAIKAAKLIPERRAAAAKRLMGKKIGLGPRSEKAKANMLASWTPERRAAQAAKMLGNKYRLAQGNQP